MKDENIYCVICGNEVKNLEEGCKKCNSTNSSNSTFTNIITNENTTANVLKFFAIIILILGFIVSIFVGTDEYNDFNFFYFCNSYITYIFISLILFALKEIINILNQIMIKIIKKK